MFESITTVSIVVSFVAIASVLLLSFKIHEYREKKESVSEFFLVIDADAEYRIIACCTYFEDALKLCRELFDKDINADVIPVDLNTVYDYE